MLFYIVLIVSIVAQLTAAALSMRINARYRRYSAWLLLSAASVMMAVVQMYGLWIIWEIDRLVELITLFDLWTACLGVLLISVLSLGGVALIEPLFIGAAKTESLLKQEKHELESVVRENDAELRLAGKIQQRLLPRTAPELPGYDIAGRCTAAQWTSGDYFDFIPMGRGTLGIVVADVSGHGSGPAILMGTTRAFLRAAAQMSTDVGEVLTSANRLLSDDLSDGRFVTLFFASIEPASGKLCYSNAGHIGYLITADDSVRKLGMERPPLGVLSNPDFSAADPIEMKSGDTLLLVSDGISETRSPSGELFGESRMLQCFRDNRTNSAEEILQALHETVRQFAEQAPQEDDITTVVLIRR